MRKHFLGYDCAITIRSKKGIADKLEALDIVKLSFKSIVVVAQFRTSHSGWGNYYVKFRLSTIIPVTIPVFVKNAGMIAIITVSGLHDEEDHKIIIDALKGKFFD